MNYRILRKTCFFLLAVALCCGGQAHAQWQPEQAIRIMVAFKPGGGADTMARMLADELSVRTGWQVEVENMTGLGGVNMAQALRVQSADGLVLGFGVAETWTYNLQSLYAGVDSIAGYTFLASVVPTEVGLVVRANRGWRSMDDMVRNARAGGRMKLAVLNPRLEDLTRALANHFGIEVETLHYRTGAEVLEAVLTGEVHAGWVSRQQQADVQAGNVVNLVSGETRKLSMSPRAATLGKYGFDFSAGTRFVLVAPAGLSGFVQEALVDPIREILEDKNSRVHQFTSSTFGRPEVESGNDLLKWLESRHEESTRLLALRDARQ